MERLKMETRSSAGNMKLVDWQILEEIRKTEGLHRFYSDKELDLDVSKLSAISAAKQIVEFVHSFPELRHIAARNES